MGIRFLCPNGHKLNVKAFLAGKWGICPQCDAKFLVPQQSDGQAEVIDEAESSAAESSATGSSAPLAEVSSASAVPLTPPEMPAAASSPTEVAPTEVAPPEAWYVRTAAGEQYGPANIEVMHGWVAEGRVTVDCWVWRTGWPEWKTGGQAITLLNGPPPDVSQSVASQPVAPTVEPPDNEAIAAPQELPAVSLPKPTSSKVQYRSSKRNRQERARRVTFFLGAVVLLLFAVLVVVLINNSR